MHAKESPGRINLLVNILRQNYHYVSKLAWETMIPLQAIKKWTDTVEWFWIGEQKRVAIRLQQEMLTKILQLRSKYAKYALGPGPISLRANWHNFIHTSK